MKIAHVLTPARIGGAETVAAALARGQQERGHEVHVAVVVDPAREDPQILGALERTSVSLLPWRVGPRDYLSEARLVRDLCRRLEPDVLHTHGYRSDVVAGLASRSLGVPRVATVHGFCGGDWKNRLYERLQRWSYRTFEGVVAVSRELGVKLVRDDGLAPHRVHVIRNAFPDDVEFEEPHVARRILGLGADATLVGWVGRLSREKGLDVLLSALADLTDLDVRLVVVGEGSRGEALRRLADELGVADRTVWAGGIPDAATLFRAFDLFCLSSRTEGMPMVLLEAMAAGVPIVATRAGGVEEAVTEEEAWLVPPETPSALSAALRSALGAPGEASTRAKRARQRLAEEFDADEWLARYDRLYRQVAGRPAPTS